MKEVEGGSSWTIIDVDWLQSRRFVPGFADMVFISSRPRKAGLYLPFASTVPSFYLPEGGTQDWVVLEYLSSRCQSLFNWSSSSGCFLLYGRCNLTNVHGLYLGHIVHINWYSTIAYLLDSFHASRNQQIHLLYSRAILDTASNSWPFIFIL